jgi:hypothetical protein
MLLMPSSYDVVAIRGRGTGRGRGRGRNPPQHSPGILVGPYVVLLVQF